MDISSQDMHPTAGGRFVFERQADNPPSYKVTAYLPNARTVVASLHWDAEGNAQLSSWTDPTGTTIPDEPWVVDQAYKLARVLKRDPKPKLTRWRG